MKYSCPKLRYLRKQFGMFVDIIMNTRNMVSGGVAPDFDEWPEAGGIMARIVEIKGKTLASIIPTLVSGLYSDRFDLIREYCQNAYDAILLKYGEEASIKGLVDIRIDGRNISIHDNGTGMTKEVVANLATLGYTTKDTPEQVGDRGIGRLSGICAARKIHFVTKAAGDSEEWIFEINAGDLVASLDRETKLTKDAGEILASFSKARTQGVRSSEINKSYTTVILYDIIGSAGKLLDDKQTREYLELTLPVYVNPKSEYSAEIRTLYNEYLSQFPNICLRLNGKQIYKPFHRINFNSNHIEYESQVIKNDRGKTIAVVWYIWDPSESSMINNEWLRGLRFRQKSFTIGNSMDMREILNTSPVQVADWFAGEVIVVDEDCIVSSDRSRFEDNEARAVLLGSLEQKIGKRLTRIANERSYRNKTDKLMEKAKDVRGELSKIVNPTTHVSEKEAKKTLTEARKVRMELEKRKTRATDNKEQHKMKSLITGISEGERKASKTVRANDNPVTESMDQQARMVYSILIDAINKNWERSSTVEELITRIEKVLIKKL